MRFATDPKVVEIDDELPGLVLVTADAPGLGRTSARLKRAFDVCFAALVLILGAPLFGAIALLVKLDGPGPVIFAQTRIGREGRAFRMLKFRTMIDGADDLKPELLAANETQGLFKIARDPRVTRAGRWLRQISLDELPQLLNVLRGEMSLVGPRPLVPLEDAQIIGADRRRLHLAPGMTGLWQLLAAPRAPLAEMVALDHLYAANWSLWADLKILVRTAPHVLGRRGV